MSADPGRIDSLWRERPRSLFVRISLWLFLLLLAGSWFVGDFQLDDAFSDRRMRNLDRFLGEVRPYALKDRDWDWSVVGTWAGDLMSEKGFDAAMATLAISVLAIVLAALGSLVLILPSARNFASPEPFAPGPQAPSRWQTAFWKAVMLGTRLVLILLRSLPEYIWAFLILAMVGHNAWPAVLALAIHNVGILGRLNAETVENVEAKPLRALRALGANRGQIASVGLLPAILPRFLLYFFYRWETCVREATVLGMLGIVSLGYWIEDARVRFRYDDLMFFVLLGVAIVLIGDFLSAIARRLVRRAS